MFDHPFNAGYSWSEASKKNPEILSSLEKEARVWKMVASTNAASSTSMAASSATGSTTETAVAASSETGSSTKTTSLTKTDTTDTTSTTE